MSTQRALVERSGGDTPGARTPLTLQTDGHGAVSIDVGPTPVERAWTVRLHLRRGQRLVRCSVDGADMMEGVQVLRPMGVHASDHAAATATATPFGGRGSQPAPLAGPIVEIALPRAMHARRFEAVLEAELEVVA